jgi:hypothetical protein
MSKKELVPAAPRLSKTDAQQLCDKIRGRMEGTADLVVQLYEGNGWTSLGYLSWNECCEKEFNKTARWANYQVKAAIIRRALAPPKPKPPKQIAPPTNGSKGMEIISGGLSKEEGGCTEGDEQPDGGDSGDHPAMSAAVATAIATVPEDKRQAVLDWAIAKAEGKKLTVPAIRQAIKDVLEAEPDDDEPPASEPTVEDAMKAANTVLHKFALKIAALVKEADAIDNPHLTDELNNRLETVKAQLKSAAGTIRSAMGAGVCTYCDGKGCKACLNTGWLTKASLEAAPEKAA